VRNEERRRRLTDFNISTSIQQDIVTLDVTVDDALGVEVLQATASLVVVSHEWPAERFTGLTS
jgi:hypothetical protein